MKNLPKFWWIIIIISLTFSWFYIRQVTRPKVKELYILNQNNQPRLTVWLTTKLKTFDLKTGQSIGQLNLVWGYGARNYQIFGPFGNKAWGYVKKTGLVLIDMTKPSLIATEKDILRKNPKLGKVFRLNYGDYIYDPVAHGIQVIAQDGRYFRINPNLTTTHLKRFAYHYIPKHEYWTFDLDSASAGKTLRRRGAPKTNSKKAVLLGPAIIKELNKKAVANNKVWVLHYSTMFGPYDLYISYMNAKGQELNRINLTKLLKDKNAKPVAILTRNKEILVFVTKGSYTLTALRADPVTGKIRSRIDYIK